MTQKPTHVDVPGLGRLTRDEQLDQWLRSEPLRVKVLGERECRIVLEDYEDDPHPEDFHVAVANFLALEPAVLKAAEPHLYAYYLDYREHYDDLVIPNPRDVWKHIRLGREPTVSRNPYDDKGIYVSLECGCAWEDEHGLQIVFQNGLRVTKVGPYDGQLTRTDPGVIY